MTTLLVGLAAGLAPSLHASRPDLTGVLRGGVRDGSSHRSTVRSGLLISQIALSCVLLAGAGLFVRSLRRVEGVDIGYDQDRLVFAGVDLSAESGRKPEEGGRLLADAVQRIAQLPGVERVAVAMNAPMWGFSFMDSFLPNGDTLPRLDGSGPNVSFVSPGFFSTVGMRVLQGRDFSADDRGEAEPVIIVNATLARTVWPGLPAVGQCLVLDKTGTACRRVVGVVSNAAQQRRDRTAVDAILRAAPARRALAERRPFRGQSRFAPPRDGRKWWPGKCNSSCFRSRRVE